MELQQQPEFCIFNLQYCNGQSNSDPMTQCLYRAIHNQIEHPELGVQYGMLLVWDEKIKQYDPFWAYHAWNVSEDETILYDNFELLEEGIRQYNYQLKNPINKWNIKIVDGSNLKAKNHYLKCWDVIDKVTKPYKGQYDAIYLQNFGFRPNGYTQITWEMFESDCNDTEELLLSNQSKITTTNDKSISVIDSSKMTFEQFFENADRNGADSFITPDFEFYVKENGKWVKQSLGQEFEKLKLSLHL